MGPGCSLGRERKRRSRMGASWRGIAGTKTHLLASFYRKFPKLPFQGVNEVGLYSSQSENWVSSSFSSAVEGGVYFHREVIWYLMCDYSGFWGACLDRIWKKMSVLATSKEEWKRGKGALWLGGALRCGIISFICCVCDLCVHTELWSLSPLLTSLLVQGDIGARELPALPPVSPFTQKHRGQGHDFNFVKKISPPF